ncbi:GerMN domain-containing protein [Clostridium sp.]|uniref:GerMN domain-containing protein n=1 Tax=Clostridium sp. TaxID=1506 RepID=UPI00321694A9
MNKKRLYIIILFIAVFITGCSEKNNKEDANINLSNSVEISNNVATNDNEVNNNSEVNSNKAVDSNNDVKVTSKYKINDYITINENAKYSYKGENSEYAEFVAYVDYISGDKFQIRTNNGGSETVMVLQIKDGELRQTFRRGVCYYRENFTTKQSTSSEILLKEPLVKGTSWTLSDGSKRYISNVNVQVETPSGNYSAIEVTTERNNGEKSLHYYALNNGLVKYVGDSENMKITSTLQGIEDNIQLTQTVRFYYPDINVDKIYYEDKELSFSTNDITKMTLQNILKEFPGNDKGSLLGKNVTINSLYLNDDGKLYVDFTSNFVKEMNSGSSTELMILQSIVNTFGNYYGVDQVYITIDNKAYSSGHILKSPGECFKVDFNGVTEGK